MKKKTRTEIFMERPLEEREVSQALQAGLESLRRSIKAAKHREKREFARAQLTFEMQEGTPEIPGLENKE